MLHSTRRSLVLVSGDSFSVWRPKCQWPFNCDKEKEKQTLEEFLSHSHLLCVNHTYTQCRAFCPRSFLACGFFWQQRIVGQRVVLAPELVKEHTVSESCSLVSKKLCAKKGSVKSPVRNRSLQNIAADQCVQYFIQHKTSSLSLIGKLKRQVECN